MTRPVYELMAEPCDQCLTTKERIVPGARAAQLIEDCKRQGVKFVCHKASIAGRNIACRGVHDAIGGCQVWQFATRVGIEVVQIDPESL